MALVFPLSEQSAVNVLGIFNGCANVTYYEDELRGTTSKTVEAANSSLSLLTKQFVTLVTAATTSRTNFTVEF